MKISIICIIIIVLILFGLIGYSCCAMSSKWSRYEEQLKEQNLWQKEKDYEQRNED